ncbi:MAG: hypothetical protein LBQ54_15225 [Planctomycetaceae bacterium]|nr:hypothetical protein [Planctomycetaceae bacterium]
MTIRPPIKLLLLCRTATAVSRWRTQTAAAPDKTYASTDADTFFSTYESRSVGTAGNGRNLTDAEKESVDVSIIKNATFYKSSRGFGW